MIHLRPFKQPQWSQDDAIALREFLSSRTGQRMWENLTFFRPSLPAVNLDANTQVASAQNAAGYEKVLDELLRLTVSPDENKTTPQPEMYPNLFDDSKWDGEDITKSVT